MLLRKAFGIAILTIVAGVIQSQQVPQLPNNANINPPLATLPATSSSKCPTRKVEQSDMCLKSNAARALNSPPVESFLQISKGAQKFALEFLARMSDIFLEARLNRDYMISPFSVWALLLLLTEASSGKSLSQLRTTLHIQDVDQLILRGAFNEVQKYLQLKTPTIEVASLQAIFVDVHECVDENYKRVVESCYSAKVESLRFDQVQFSSTYIKNIVEAATNKLITYQLNPDDLQESGLLMVSSLYFNGQWKRPFNSSLTRSEPFYDEDGTPIGNVEMMVQESNFNYTGMTELEGHVLELPYGNENRLCMLVVLPRKGVSINKVTHNLQRVGIAPILSKLAAAGENFEDEEVEVFLPKFTTSSDLLLNDALKKMGIRDIFEPHDADLSKLSPALYVSSIAHNTKIIVNEEGTKAAAVTSAVLANKATPPKFYLNRPFLYLIVEKRSNLLLFAGQITNPNNVR